MTSSCGLFGLLLGELLLVELQLLALQNVAVAAAGLFFGVKAEMATDRARKSPSGEPILVAPRGSGRAQTKHDFVFQSHIA